MRVGIEEIFIKSYIENASPPIVQKSTAIYAELFSANASALASQNILNRVAAIAVATLAFPLA